MQKTIIEKINSGKYDKIILSEIANGKTYTDISNKTGLKNII